MGGKHWAALAVMLMLGGCAVATGANTPSGRPERTVNLSADAARTKITGGMINRGFSLRSDSPSRVVFFRAGDTGTGGLIAASYGAEAAFTIISTGANSSRVMVEVNGIMYADSWREAKSGMALTTASGGAEVMAAVNAVLASL
jgi:hypothetical protein